MPHVHKSVLVEHSAHKMFLLVDQVENYPQFLPWCAFSTVHSRDEQHTVATLGIDYLRVKQQFTTQNRKAENLIFMHLQDGPFQKLAGAWRFIPLADWACKVEFELEYEFSSRTLETLIGPVFSKIANTFVDAFIRQADKIYGAE